MYRDIAEINVKLESLYEDLVNIAMEDSILTDDEQSILESIKMALNLLSKQLIQILENDLDDHEFQDISAQILSDIVEDAKKVAHKDGIITNDEKRLLDKLTQVLESGELFK